MAVTLEVGGNGVDVYQLQLGISAVENFITYKVSHATYSDKEEQLRASSPIYEIKYHQKYSVGKVSFAKIFKNFEQIDKDQVIAHLDDKPIKSPMNGKILLYPRKWFEPDSPTKPDGIFAIIQETQVLPE